MPSVDSTRDAQFIHSFVLFHLLSQRAARDLVLISALQNSPPTNAKFVPSEEENDPRVNPALVKLMDTVLQSLNQIRELSIVDENPDLATHLDGCIGYTKARRYGAQLHYFTRNIYL
jgi:signal recognition particle subunit SRP68